MRRDPTCVTDVGWVSGIVGRIERLSGCGELLGNVVCAPFARAQRTHVRRGGVREKGGFDHMGTPKQKPMDTEKHGSSIQRSWMMLSEPISIMV